MKLFLDTEFSSLRWGDARLISLALVAEDDRELYVEMPTHTWRWKPSEFVVSVVEPLLWGGSHEATDAADFCRRVRTFLSSFDSAQIVTDAPTWDMEFLRLTLRVDGAEWPANVKTDPIYFNPESATLHDEADLLAREAFEAHFAEPGQFRHHALTDARALRAGWLAWHGDAS